MAPYIHNGNQWKANNAAGACDASLMERRVICSLLYTPGSRQRWRLCKEPYIHPQTGGGGNERDRKEGGGGNDEGRKRAKERQLKREEEERLTKGRREAGEEDEEGRGRGFQLNSDFIM